MVALAARRQRCPSLRVQDGRATIHGYPTTVGQPAGVRRAGAGAKGRGSACGGGRTVVAGLHWRSVKEACPWTSERHGPGRVADRLRGRGGRRRPIDDIAEFAYLTGWRKSEILGLRWAWVDRHTRVIRLPGSKNAHRP